MRGSAGVDRLHLRRITMDDTISPHEYRDADCSGRSLATLIVAWVAAAMVASVLLRWTYMWIALAVLTLLFLFACGYAACNARRIHERTLAREVERRRRRELVTVSGGIDNYGQIIEPPANYPGYWIADLPPSYATVVSSLPPPPPPPPSPPPPPPARFNDEELNPSGPRLSSPPPYSVAILSESLPGQPIDYSSERQSRAADRSTDDRDAIHCQAQTQIIGPAAIPGHLANHLSQSSTIPLRAVANSAKVSVDVVDDKSNRVQPYDSQQSQGLTVLSTGTHYLTSIISCTFGRGQKKTNAEHDPQQQQQQRRRRRRRQSGPNEERPDDSRNSSHERDDHDAPRRLTSNTEQRDTCPPRTFSNC